MADNSSIEWCDSTFNPWIGCTKVGPGCDHCYAERDMDLRRHRVRWGAGQPRSRTSADYWRGPIRWNAQNFRECKVHGWRGETAKKGAGWACPLRSEGSECGLVDARRRVFCASLADVFDNEAPFEWRSDLFRLIENTPNLDWLLLTKRIGNVPSRVGIWPRNAALGITITSQAEADRDVIKALRVKRDLDIPMLFLSCEPLLGPLRLWLLGERDYQEHSAGAEVYPLRGMYAIPDNDWAGPKVDWVIAGGESGPGARPMHPDWIRSLRDQCASAGTPFLFKQWGAWAPGSSFPDRIPSGEYCDFDGSLTHDDDCVWRVPKKVAGRLLDGVAHNGFPEVA